MRLTLLGNIYQILFKDVVQLFSELCEQTLICKISDVFYSFPLFCSKEIATLVLQHMAQNLH